MNPAFPNIAKWREPLFSDVSGDIGVSFEFFRPRRAEE